MGLDKDRAVRIAVTLKGGRRWYGLGSGYLIADGLVLTAARVLRSADGEAPGEGQPAEVKRASGDWRAAIVVWLDVARDVAVLPCPKPAGGRRRPVGQAYRVGACGVGCGRLSGGLG